MKRFVIDTLIAGICGTLAYVVAVSLIDIDGDGFASTIAIAVGVVIGLGIGEALAARTQRG